MGNLAPRSYPEALITRDYPDEPPDARFILCEITSVNVCAAAMIQPKIMFG
jgi:hypothetical protein